MALREEATWTGQRTRMVLPTFLIIGAQKSGTSSLWAYLRSHPQVFVAPVKELNFFSLPGDALDMESYAHWFEDASDAIAIGEASPNYTIFPLGDDVPAKIARALPDVRLIYLMRDPIERMRSAYQHQLSSGVERRKIGKALLEDPSYLQLTMYATQLDQYLRWFPRSQLLLLTTEQLKTDRAATLRQVLSFIGVDSDWQPADLDAEYNTSSGKQRTPRGWSRLLGGLLIRSGAVKFSPRKATKALGHPVLTRTIRRSEVTVPDAVRQQLVAAIRPEVERLAPLMPASFDGWGLLDVSAKAQAR